MGIRAFLDRSGQRQSDFATLAGFAGPISTWAEFDRGWKVVLTTGFRPVPYFHVVEALGLRPRSPFDRGLGWERRHIWDLLAKLIVYMGEYSKGRLTMHSCVIHMDAWRKLSASGVVIPSEVDLCNRYVSDGIVALFARKILEEHSDESEIQLHTEDLLSFEFDRNEPFLGPFRELINRRKEEAETVGVSTIWHLVDGINEGNMKCMPGLQAADIFAWAINRENTVAEGEDGKYIAHLLRQVVMSFTKEYDRSALLNEFGSALRFAQAGGGEGAEE